MQTVELTDQAEACRVALQAYAYPRLVELLETVQDQSAPAWLRGAARIELPHVARLLGAQLKTGQEV